MTDLIERPVAMLGTRPPASVGILTPNGELVAPWYCRLRYAALVTWSVPLGASTLDMPLGGWPVVGCVAFDRRGNPTREWQFDPFKLAPGDVFTAELPL